MTPAFAQALAAFSPQLPLAVAYSGGADSSALLRACAQRWPGQVLALHVHHGLQAAGDDFLQHCQSVCAQLAIPLAVARVDARHRPGQSPEEAARQHRYAALCDLARSHFARPAASIALAQHADDQVETLLLALSRGAGVAGLAAMPAHWQAEGLHWHRPLLAVPGQDLRRWLEQIQAPWVEDPSNADERFTRNRIRHKLLPVLEAVFPQFRTTFARSCAHAAQAKDLLAALAQHDAATTGLPPLIAALQSLPTERQTNLLRYWLLHHHGTTPSTAQIQALLVQIAACRTRGHHIQIKMGSGFVCRKGANLYWYNPQVLVQKP